jgi:hypothetical protein
MEIESGGVTENSPPASNFGVTLQGPFSRSRMSSRSYLITALPRTASYSEAVRTHWREYLMEAAEVGLLMMCICFTGAFVYSEGSPLRHLSLSLTAKSFLMGGLVAASTYFIIRSRFGRRSGAHLNPAFTLA